MAYPPGEFPASALVKVEANGATLSKISTNAYRRVKGTFQSIGKNLTIVDDTSGYRNAATQNAMRAAGQSPPNSAARKKYNLSATSTISIAAHPNGTHEDGRCMDILIDGSDNPSPSDIALLKKYGWIQQFGEADRNHFRHDGLHAIWPTTRAWCIRHHVYVG